MRDSPSTQAATCMPTASEGRGPHTMFTICSRRWMTPARPAPPPRLQLAHQASPPPLPGIRTPPHCSVSCKSRRWAHQHAEISACPGHHLESHSSDIRRRAAVSGAEGEGTGG